MNHGYQEAVLFKDSHEEEELDHGKGDEHKSEFGQIECVVLVILNILLIENGDDQENPELRKVCKIPACEIAQSLFFNLDDFNTEEDRRWEHCNHVHNKLQLFIVVIASKECDDDWNAEHENIHYKHGLQNPL